MALEFLIKGFTLAAGLIERRSDLGSLPSQPKKLHPTRRWRDEKFPHLHAQ